MTLCYQNVRGLRSKIRTFYNNVTQANLDIIALTETFLTSSVSDGELFPSSYIVVRKDRLGDVGWGGVLLAVRDSCEVRVISDIDGMTPDKELIFALVSCKNVKFLCCVVYLPPNYCDDQYIDVLTCIENALCTYSNLNVLVLGDFNLNSCSTNVKTQFNIFCDFCNLQQHNTVLNTRSGLLDLVLSDYDHNQLKVFPGLDPLVPIDEYHPSLDVKINLSYGEFLPGLRSSPDESSHAIPDWNWRKADFQALYTALAKLDWSELMTFTDVNSAVNFFYNKLKEIINLYVPNKKLSPNHRQYVYPKWFTPEIIENIKKKYFHLKRFKQEGKLFNKELFSFYRWRVKTLIDNAYEQHLKLIQKSIIDDPVFFWKYVSDKKKERRHTETFSYKGAEVTGQDAANAFAEYFGSVFHNEKPLLNYVDAENAANSQNNVMPISVRQVDESDFRLAIRRLKPRSAGGPDRIPAFLVKDCAPALRSPLLFIFNLSLRQAKYPEQWKLSRVTPVPKGEPGKDVSAFRPIAVLSVLAKIFETMLDFRIRNQVDNILHESQHGFRKNRATTTNLIAHVDYVCAEMDSRRQVDAAYFDFRKAFDLVSNDILLHKLAKLGFTPKLLQLFASYLDNRRQFVRVSGFESADYFTRSGMI
ncbi:unnamed protein product [Parnassius mnemosyne]|uniref:Reverse transcriptase domain-containing protein n=1 Tax=Parnassius mnemosyne TaxID=213953 RepID=A0AAV1KEN0_9NEOP